VDKAGENCVMRASWSVLLARHCYGNQIYEYSVMMHVPHVGVVMTV